MSTLDWSICVGYLVIVSLQGWWLARQQHDNEDYFVGSRRMNWIAVGVSLFATTFSSLSFVGLPREAAYEDYHLYLAILFIPLVVAPIVGWLFIPLYHRIGLISAYEYLERRFSRPLRLVGSGLFCLYTLGWMGSMLYAVGLILQAVLDLSSTQMAWTLVGLGVFTTAYTSAGGYRAVVWTDVLQAILLGGSVVAILLLAVDKIDGGWASVWSLGSRHGKLEMFDFRFDLTDRANFYTACAYGLFVYLAANATGQSAVQRYVSMPSVSAARWSLVVNGVLVAVVCLLFFVLGTTLFAFYQQNPASGTPGAGAFPDLPSQDQLATHFIRTELAYPGLLGVLLAGLFCAAMSSVDSGINNLTALVVCDWLGGRHLGLRESRLLCAFFGVVTIIVSLLVPYLGKNVFDIIITIAGAFFGPLFALFLLGMLVPRAGTKAALVGLVAGAASLALVYPTRVSPWWYGAFTCVPTFAVGYLVSLFSPLPRAGKLEEAAVC